MMSPHMQPAHLAASLQLVCSKQTHHWVRAILGSSQIVQQQQTGTSDPAANSQSAASVASTGSEHPAASAGPMLMPTALAPLHDNSQQQLHQQQPATALSAIQCQWSCCKQLSQCCTNAQPVQSSHAYGHSAPKSPLFNAKSQPAA